MKQGNFVRVCALMCVGLPLAQAAEHAPSRAFERYQAWQETPVADWRSANERVGEIGGWRAYLRESQAVDDAGVQDQGLSPAQPAGPGHPGHHGHHHHHQGH